MNVDLFYPGGLYLNVIKPRKMLEKINHPDEKLLLGALEKLYASADALAKPKRAAKAAHAETGEDDYKMRWIEALKGFTMPLDLTFRRLSLRTICSAGRVLDMQTNVQEAAREVRGEAHESV